MGSASALRDSSSICLGDPLEHQACGHLSVCPASLSFPKYFTQPHISGSGCLSWIFPSSTKFCVPVPQTLMLPSLSCHLWGHGGWCQHSKRHILPIALDPFLVSHPVLISEERHHHLGLHSFEPESSLTPFTPTTHHPSVSPSCQILFQGGSQRPPPCSKQSLPEPNRECFDIWTIHPSTHHPPIIHHLRIYSSNK